MPPVIPLPHLMYDLDDLTEKFANGSANNSTTTIYTTPADTIAYLTDIVVGARNNGAAFLVAEYRIYDDTPTQQWSMFQYTFANIPETFIKSFYPPIQLPEGWTVQAVSGNASLLLQVGVRVLERAA